MGRGAQSHQQALGKGAWGGTGAGREGLVQAFCIHSFQPWAPGAGPNPAPNQESWLHGDG
jgi:hypothetical protein